MRVRAGPREPWFLRSGVKLFILRETHFFWIPYGPARSHIRHPTDGGDGMQSQNRFFDDLARVVTGALGTLSGVKTEVEARLRDQLERVLAGVAGQAHAQVLLQLN